MDIGLPEYADGEPRGAVIKAHGSLAARSEQQIALAQGAAEKKLYGVHAAGVGFRHADQFLVGGKSAAEGGVRAGKKRGVEVERQDGGQGHAASDGEAGAGMSVKAHGGKPGGRVRGKNC